MGVLKNNHILSGARGGVILTAALIVLILSGCGGSSTAPKKKAKEKGPAKAEQAAPAPEKTAGETPESKNPPPETAEYRYEARGRRDPFRSVLETKRDKKALADLPPLQRLELSDMQLSGIVWGTMGYAALITTPDGKGYTVRTGTILGPRGGVVKKITKTEIIIQETIEDIFGAKKTRQIVKELHPQEEGKE
jgi:type IV pilus assembly protein PilP